MSKNEIMDEKIWVYDISFKIRMYRSIFVIIYGNSVNSQRSNIISVS